MAFIRSKEIHGRRYYYLVKNRRMGDKVMQKVIKYLGKAPTLSDIPPGYKEEVWTDLKKVRTK